VEDIVGYHLHVPDKLVEETLEKKKGKRKKKKDGGKEEIFERIKLIGQNIVDCK